MVPSGPPTPVGGAHSVAPSLVRSNSGLLGGALSSSIPSQQPFSSLVSPRTQFNSHNNNNSMNILGNISNVSSLINHSMGNGVNLQHLGSTEPDPLSFVSSGAGPSMNQLPGDHSQSQQLDPVQNFQQQFSVPQQQQQQQQQQHRGGLGNVGGLAPVKLEPQMGPSDQNGPSSQQLQTLRSIGGVKMEPQHLQSIRSLGPVKLEQAHSDSSIFLQQQQHHQQQQQLLQMSRQSPQAAVQLNLLQQQRIMQLQQQQHQHHQQQLLNKGLPPRAQLQQQLQQSLPLRTQLKPSNYEPGICARRLTQYMYHQQHRPEDNNIEFWRKFVTEFFAPNAKKRWCVSLYGSGRQTTGVFPQDVWHCEICNRKPGRGFETTAEVLPRLCQIKYASGTLEELLYVDMPRESHNAMGQIILDYPKAIQESVFEQLRIVRDGHLRIVFNPDLKISSWEFCARKHEELIPRRLIIPQVSQLGAVVQKYQTAVQNASSGVSTQDLQNSCNSFVASARQLAKALEVPLVNDLGYTKRYVRCLQISEVVNSMKDLIGYSREIGTGPMDSLIKFPRRTSNSGLHPQQAQQPEGHHQTIAQNSNGNGQSSAHSNIMQLASCSNGVGSVNNSVNGPSSASPSTTAIPGLLHHQNSMNSRQESQLGSVNGPYGVNNTMQMPATSSSSSVPQSQPNPSSPFSPHTPPASNNTLLTSHNTTTHLNSVSSPANLSGMQQQQQQQQPAQPPEPDPSDTQSSVQQIIQEMMMSSSPLNGASTMGNETKGMNGISSSMNGGLNNSGIGGRMGFGNMGGVGPSATVSGLTAAMVNSGMGMNGRVGMNHMSQDVMGMNPQQQQQNMGNRLMDGLGSVNDFNNLHYDWKPSP